MKSCNAILLTIFNMLTLTFLAGCATTPPGFPYDTSKDARARFTNSAKQVQDTIVKNVLGSKRVLLSLSTSSPRGTPSALLVAAEQFKATLDKTYLVVTYAAYRTPVDQLFSTLNLSHGELISAFEEISALAQNQRFVIVAFDSGALAQCIESIRFASRDGLRINVEAVFAVNIDPNVVAKFSNTGLRIVALRV